MNGSGSSLSITSNSKSVFIVVIRLHSTQNWPTNLPFFISIAPVLDLAGFGDVVPEFLHVPGGGGAAFGAEAAVEADVLVLCHDAARLEAVGDVNVLREVEGGNL